MGIAIALCLAAGAIAAAPASAAEQLGSTSFAGACDDGDPGDVGNTWIQGASVTGPDYRADAPGVVTSWSTTAFAVLNTYQLMVLRPDGGTTAPYGYTPMQKDIPRTLTTVDTVNTFTDVHIPINAGETIGFFVPYPQPGATGYCVTNTGAAGDSVQRFDGDPPLAISTNFNAPQINLKMNLSATVEPDADGDLFGDETQDACPTQAAVQTACPILLNTPVPTTQDTPPQGTPAKKCKPKKSKSKKSASAAEKKRGCKTKKKKKNEKK